MTDQTDVREFLHRMAEEAGFAPVEPGPVVRKARRRLARTVGGTLFMAGALVAGALVAANGLMNAARTQMPQPAGQPTPGTTENGQAVPDRYSILDGEVTFAAAPPWREDSSTEREFSLTLRGSYSGVGIRTDPFTVLGCEAGPVPADAEALARSIRSHPYLEATAPVSVSVGGIDALRMDVAWPGPGCSMVLGEQPYTELGFYLPNPSWRMRLYLLGLPEGMSARILAIVILAPEQVERGEPRDFEQVVEAAAPILDSFEFHAP